MKRWKSSKPCDRLSELPDMVIFHILSFLSMRDVVRTTLVSKRWEDLWTMIPCLTFRGIEEPSHRFRRLVNGVLIFWRGTTILKFKVDMVFNPSFTCDLDTWLCFAKKKLVEELHLELSGSVNNYTAPQCLYSCSSMRNLSLLGCDLKLNGKMKIHWNHLKSLRIERVMLSEHVINQLVSGSPRLEVLFLSFKESYENLNVHSTSLKMLKIETVAYHQPDKHTMLRIWAPNLETLEMKGCPYSRSELMNISSICSATVCVFAPERCRYVNRFSVYQLFEQMLGQLPQSTRPVEKVSLCYRAIKFLAEMKKTSKDMVAPLSNAKFLKIYGGGVDEMMDVLEIFPNLTMLVREHNPVVASDKYLYHFKILCHDKEPFDSEDSLEHKTDIPILPHLRTVEVTWVFLDNSIFPFIDFLLKCDKLEKVVFKVKRIESSPKPLDPSLCLTEYLFSVAQKLLSVQRSLPAAEVIMCSDDSITSKSIC